ncbi:phosphotyrosine protein phosphatase [Candidatus Woesearchaeota archaeon]|nr:phosphotyrosine protein phosphatase [Candidatus Woesearchaeota archaeon]
MKVLKVLFICNQNLNRSKTAEEIFGDDYETRSAGLFNEKPVTREQLLWADVVVSMEDFQRKELSERFPDVCIYYQPELVRILRSKMAGLLKP